MKKIFALSALALAAIAFAPMSQAQDTTKAKSASCCKKGVSCCKKEKKATAKSKMACCKKDSKATAKAAK